MRPQTTLSIPGALAAIRKNDTLRDDVLALLAQRNRAQIAAIVARAMGGIDPGGMIDGEARSAFMLAADRALKSARTEDDGRGKNDPFAWATYRGLNGVRDLLRTTQGEKRSPLKQRYQASLVFSCELEDSGSAKHRGKSGEDSPSALRSYDTALAGYGYETESAEATTVAHLGLEELLASLDAQERLVAELLLYGQSGTLEMVCPCVTRHSVERDLAHTLGITRESAQALVERVQVAASAVFGLCA